MCVDALWQPFSKNAFFMNIVTGVTFLMGTSLKLYLFVLNNWAVIHVYS